MESQGRNTGSTISDHHVKNIRITGLFTLEGLLEVIQYNPPLELGPVRAVAQGSIQLSFEHGQGWRSHRPYGHLFQCLITLIKKKFSFLYLNGISQVPA